MAGLENLSSKNIDQLTAAIDTATKLNFSHPELDKARSRLSELEAALASLIAAMKANEISQLTSAISNAEMLSSFAPPELKLARERVPKLQVTAR